MRLHQDDTLDPRSTYIAGQSTTDIIIHNATNTAGDKMNSTSTTNLEIAVNAITHSSSRTKSKKKQSINYRAHQREDGVITEYPRYVPISLPRKQTFKFEKAKAESKIPTSPPRPATQHRIVERLPDNLLKIIVRQEETRRDRYNEPVSLGKDGYIDLLYRIEKGNLERLEYQTDPSMMPMQRFLAEPGPWNMYLLQVD
ncbi:hypothetical protein P153DRAFT_371702 [Dothidotthia symphoricarpi CBS 119687]|uniref:Uncharacterized protein n=1 Tax=Dothidotthia symphoricarpi CBS 119687 TaxID=1392245 RepID=A0A6A5ZX81_9PLEO|nr:uncharacterized protein P153DRAFT_371702 [Dothidotthia symphoricarpi CBS 119687]KAF2123377.1 hypothetical protein P153DRAFT_371702 [Dothidotthia symphoricarpi CBS 119687]